MQTIPGPWDETSWPLLVLETRLTHKILLWLLAVGQFVVVFLAFFAPLTFSSALVILLFGTSAIGFVDHAKRAVVITEDKVWVRGLLRWRSFDRTPSLYLQRYRKRFLVYTKKRRTALLVIYPEFFPNPSAKDKLTELIPLAQD